MRWFTRIIIETARRASSGEYMSPYMAGWNLRCGSRSKQLALQCQTMPKRLFRLLAALLLALTIPVQGMTAVTAGQCMAAGHHQKGAGQEIHPHKHDGAAAHDEVAHSHADENAQGADDGKSAHCGPCTACCASASIAGPAGVLIASSPLKANYVFSQFPPPGVQPDGLDRPPLAL